MVIGKQNGQTLLIVVLVIIVASTVGLSIATRSITSLKSSTEEAESQKALSAAEAGIERAIQGNVPVEVSKIKVISSNGTDNSVYSTKFEPVNTPDFLINGGNAVLKDEGADVWFVDHLDNGDPNYTNPYPSSTNPTSLNLYWGSSSDATDGDCGSSSSPVAIQAIIVTRDQSSPNAIKSYRYVYDSCNSSRQNNFASPDTLVKTINNISFKYGTSNLGNGIPLPKNIILMRVVPIYKNAIIGLSAAPALPRQGYLITSTGTSGDANRRIRVFKGWPQAYLPYLSYGLFVAN